MCTRIQQSNSVYSHSTAQTCVLTFNLSNHVYSHSTEQQCVLLFNSANLCTHIQPEQPCVFAFNRATVCTPIQQFTKCYVSISAWQMRINQMGHHSFSHFLSQNYQFITNHRYISPTPKILQNKKLKTKSLKDYNN